MSDVDRRTSQEESGHTGARTGATDYGTRFDEAWELWRRDVTDAVTLEAQGTSSGVLAALQRVGVFDAEDGLLLRDWALGLMTREPACVAPLRAEGMDDAAIAGLVALIERHPTPAAGG